jgi:Flp pilus assembly protein TadB
MSEGFVQSVTAKVLAGVLSACVIAGVPWAFTIESRVSHAAEAIHKIAPIAEGNREAVIRIEERIAGVQDTLNDVRQSQRDQIAILRAMNKEKP